MRIVPAVLLSVVLTAPSLVTATPIKLLHTWQNPSELKALAVLTKDLDKRGLQTSDCPPKKIW